MTLGLPPSTPLQPLHLSAFRPFAPLRIHNFHFNSFDLEGQVAIDSLKLR